ncbi:2-dehydropantoate 2-reductase [Ferrimonas balearica]|nr:2-dehydropantoate 2-reductase [Ferrimonas balearica]
MKVAVIGCGAIGGWLTAGLVRGGAEAVVLARGATLAALRAEGLMLDEGAGPERIAVTATGDPADLAGADLLVLGVKAHALPGLLPAIEAAMGPETLVMPAVNGLPFWFLQDFGGPAEGMGLDAVDPGGALARAIPSERIVGNVVHAASRTPAPGQVQLVKANKLLLGQITPSGPAARIAALAEVFRKGGIPAEETGEIRREVWAKLWGNSNMNPLSALSRADTAAMLADPGVRALTLQMMREMADLGARIGLPGFDDMDERIATTRKLGPIRTSMLQDVEAGRRLEIDPILGALVELAGKLDMPVPAMAGVYGLTRLLDESLA